MTNLKEYAKSSAVQKKSFLQKAVGYKIEEILENPSGYLNPVEYITRYRHETCAYSTAHIFQTENGLKVALENFETKQLENLN